MKYKLLIFILLLAFNVNAMASQMMMSDTMSGMDMSVSSEEKQSPHYHSEKSNEATSGYVESSQQKASGCDEDISCSACLAHCNGVMILIEVPNFSFQNRLIFNSPYTLAEVSRSYFRLLRPPKLS